MLAYQQPWKMKHLSNSAKLCYISGQWTIFLVPILLLLLIARMVAWLVMKWMLRAAVPIALPLAARVCRFVC